MRTIVLMAGEGKRFKDAGCTVPKPLIMTNSGKSILELSTDSMPFLKEGKSSDLTFAVRSEHKEAGPLIRKIYGSKAKVVEFSKLTRGNLETAVIACKEHYSAEAPLLILDSDNVYDSAAFLPLIDSIPVKDFAVICYFKPQDDSEKWCFADVARSNSRIRGLSEKKKIVGGMPMMGVFYFSKQRLFMEAAEETLNRNEKTNNEFYMSQSIQKLINQNVFVYGFEAETVIPLGTPEDLRKYNNDF